MGYSPGGWFAEVAVQSRTLAPVTIEVWDGDVEVVRVHAVPASRGLGDKIEATWTRVTCSQPYPLRDTLAVTMHPERPAIWHLSEREGVLYVVVGRTEEERKYEVAVK